MHGIVIPHLFIANQSIRSSRGTIREIIVCKVSYRGEVTGWVTIWQLAHDNFPYHTKIEPKNEFITPLSHQNIWIRRFYTIKHIQNLCKAFCACVHGRCAKRIRRLYAAIDSRDDTVPVRYMVDECVVYAVIKWYGIIQSKGRLWCLHQTYLEVR